jgi:type I restriction enzyme, S subunit
MRLHPRGWLMRSLEEVSEVCGGIQKGPHRAPGANSARYLTVAHVQRNRILTEDPRHFEVTAEELDHWRLIPGDVLVVEGNGSSEEIGRTALFRGEIVDCVYQNHVIRVRPDPSLLNPEFLNAYLNSSAGRAAAKAQSSTSSGLRTLSVGRIKQIPVPCPPIAEQVYLSEIFGMWDRGIAAAELRLGAVVCRKLGLMQQLLTGKTRFKEFKAERWARLLLGDILTFEPRVISKPKRAFLAAGIRSHGKGVFLKPDFEAEDIALEELFQLRTDDLVVNITFAWEGAVAIVPPEADGALVSHRFPTFTFKEGVSFPGYFRHVIQQKRFVHEMGLASPGGAGRNRVLSKNGFLCIPVKLPSFEEQQRIAGALSACDREIGLLQMQLEALKKQKRGLTQKLLTGDVRVRV